MDSNKGIYEELYDSYKNNKIKPYEYYGGKEFIKAIDDAVKEELKSFEKIKTVQIENDEVVDTQFYGDILDPININEREQYTQLMNTFLNRKQKRKLSRYKGFKSFTDRIYGK